jgi:bisphosphoglycerate-dependent phosphoglycerate mutase
VPLSPRGEEEARSAGEKLRGRKIDKLYTSVLKRAIDTAEIALETAGIGPLPTERDAALNERMYGDLQGKNKAEAAREFGAEQVKLWRRSYDVRPPGGESLADTAARGAALLGATHPPRPARREERPRRSARQLAARARDASRWAHARAGAPARDPDRRPAPLRDRSRRRVDGKQYL